VRTIIWPEDLQHQAQQAECDQNLVTLCQQVNRVPSLHEPARRGVVAESGKQTTFHRFAKFNRKPEVATKLQNYIATYLQRRMKNLEEDAQEDIATYRPERIRNIDKDAPDELADSSRSSRKQISRSATPEPPESKASSVLIHEKESDTMVSFCIQLRDSSHETRVPFFQMDTLTGRASLESRPGYEESQGMQHSIHNSSCLAD
jgi:hypothetical protein